MKDVFNNGKQFLKKSHIVLGNQLLFHYICFEEFIRSPVVCGMLVYHRR